MEKDHGLPSRNAQRIFGFIAFLVSLSFIFWTYYTGYEKGYFYPKATLIFSVFGFIGLGILIFPDYRTERIVRGEDISNLGGLKLLTLRWWLILIAGFIVGFLNLTFLYSIPN